MNIVKLLKNFLYIYTDILEFFSIFIMSISAVLIGESAYKIFPMAEASIHYPIEHIIAFLLLSLSLLQLTAWYGGEVSTRKNCAFVNLIVWTFIIMSIVLLNGYPIGFNLFLLCAVLNIWIYIAINSER